MFRPTTAVCRHHDQVLDLYCPNHEALCCSKCFEGSHSKCVGIRSLQSFAAEYRKSATLCNIDEKFKIIMNNMKLAAENRKMEHTNASNMDTEFKVRFSEIHKEIIKELDRVEQNSLTEAQ